MSGRVRFANQLRGVAALSVASSHLIGVYWAMPGLVSAVTFSPPQQGDIPWVFRLVGQLWFNPGPFGVGVFFLISGMVIPFSLLKHTRMSFVGARLLRIYPTYIVALLLQYTILRIAAGLWHRPFNIPLNLLLSNCLLIYDLIGDASLDLVNWTLSVELKFYVLVVLIMPLIKRGNAAGIVGVAACIFGLNALVASGVVGDFGAPPSSLTYTFSSHSLYLTYMLIGTAFSLHLQRLLSTLWLVITVGALATLFVLTWQVSVLNTQYPVVTVNYGYALGLFAGLYAARRFVPPNRLLDGMAAISFPFYLVHSMLGYSILRALMVGLGWPFAVALLAALLATIAVAWILHVVVETPTARAGTALASARKPELHHGLM